MDCNTLTSADRLAPQMTNSARDPTGVSSPHHKSVAEVSLVADGLNENAGPDDCVGFVFDSWIPRGGRRNGMVETPRKKLTLLRSRTSAFCGLAVLACRSETSYFLEGGRQLAANPPAVMQPGLNL